MLTLNQARAGLKIVLDNQPYEIISANHQKMGRGSAKLVTKLKNLLTQASTWRTFQGDERLQEAQVNYRQAQFLYANNGVAHFMLLDDFSQHQLPEGVWSKWLKEAQKVDLVLWQDQPIAVRMPSKVSLKVVATEPASKGNTVNTATKPIKLETGVVIQAPLFIKTGDTVKIDTETGKYDSRV